MSSSGTDSGTGDFSGSSWPAGIFPPTGEDEKTGPEKGFEPEKAFDSPEEDVGSLSSLTGVGVGTITGGVKSAAGTADWEGCISWFGGELPESVKDGGDVTGGLLSRFDSGTGTGFSATNNPASLPSARQLP
ncbi:MAG TPA: hypothetical protein PLG55_08460 [Methanospirillum sp.]|uniref:hypothetical protein n=1 Tax=Methanospirillum sp. TaxID=45200 RepID=UPI001BD1E677|nr:hypothetical protein [Methanospirillum sp.]HPY60739.1 hypothetical protein [Methanospirillum sp.]